GTLACALYDHSGFGIQDGCALRGGSDRSLRVSECALCVCISVCHHRSASALSFGNLVTNLGLGLGGLLLSLVHDPRGILLDLLTPTLRRSNPFGGGAFCL